MNRLRLFLFLLLALISSPYLSCKQQDEWGKFFDESISSVNMQRLPEHKLTKIKNLHSLKKYFRPETLTQVKKTSLIDIPFLESLEGIELFPSLYELDIHRTRIESFRHIEDSKLLKLIDLDECDLLDYSDIGKSKSLERVSFDNSLKGPLIDLSGNSSIMAILINGGSFITLEQILPIKFYPSTLTLISVSNVGLRKIDSFLKHNTRINYLDVINNDIDEFYFQLIPPPLIKVYASQNPYIEKQNITEASRIINGFKIWFRPVEED